MWGGCRWHSRWRGVAPSSDAAPLRSREGAANATLNRDTGSRWSSGVECAGKLTARQSRNNLPGVTSWDIIESDVPEFAARVQRLFDAGRHKTIATLRRDGSPRISGIECEFRDGELRFASMSGARKLDDLIRNPQFAIHGPTFNPVPGREAEWPGEAKVSGRAVVQREVDTGRDPSPDGVSFIGDLSEIVITRLNTEGTKLVVESWTPAKGLREFERD